MRSSCFLAGPLVAAGVAVAATAGYADDGATKVTTHRVGDDTTIVVIERTPRDRSECLEAVESVGEQASVNGQADLAEARVDTAREHCLDGDYDAAADALTDAIDKLRARRQ